MVVDSGPTTFPIGGTVTGLGSPAATGLVLTLNGSNDLSITNNGGFNFPTVANLATGASYSVAIKTQPVGKTCTVSAGSGTVASAPVSNIVVNCSGGEFTIGGAVTGLAAGASVVLTNNGLDDLTVSDGNPFAFPTTVGTGSAYAVAVKTQPSSPVQSCIVSNGTGTVAGANVTNVAVACTTTKFKVNVSVSGLAGGSSVVLTNNGGDALTVSGNSTVPFATSVNSGAAYAVAVQTQPSSPAQTCTVGANATGTIGASDVTVAVTCSTTTFTVGGTVTGLESGKTIKLHDTALGTTDLTLTGTGADVPFTFANARNSGSGYNVSIATQPVGQVCTVGGGSGTVGSANVTNVQVNCTTGNYFVKGNLTGLDGTIRVQLNALGEQEFTANGTGLAWGPAIANGTAYTVAVTTQPTFAAGGRNQTCTVSNPTGTIAAADVTNANVACVTNKFKLAGRVYGLAAGSQVKLDNTSSDTSENSSFTLTGTGGPSDIFTFPTTMKSGDSWTVTVADLDPGHTGNTDPGHVEQTCVATVGGGVIADGDNSDVRIDCSVVTHTVSVTVHTDFVTALSHSGVDVDLTTPSSPNSPVRTSQGTFVLNGVVNDGAAWTVTPTNPTYDNTVVIADPITFVDGAAGANQTCLFGVANPGTTGTASGTINRADVTVDLWCTTDSYDVNFKVVGLDNSAGRFINVLLDGSAVVPGGSRQETSAANADFAFNNVTAQSGRKYKVSIAQQPLTGGQECRVNEKTAADWYNGVVTGNADIPADSILVACAGRIVRGDIGGLVGNLSLRNIASGAGTIFGCGGVGPCTENKTVKTVSSYNFTNPVSEGNGYDVSIQGQPSFEFTPGVTGPAFADWTVTGKHQTCAFVPTAHTGFPTFIDHDAPTGTVPTTPPATNQLFPDNVDIECSTIPHKIGGTVAGLVPGATIRIQDDSANFVDVSANGAWLLPGIGRLSGTKYTISSVTQANGSDTSGVSMRCTFDSNDSASRGTGSATAAKPLLRNEGFVRDTDTAITINCRRYQHQLSVNVSGLGATDTVSLQNSVNSGGNVLGSPAPLTGNGTILMPLQDNGSTFQVSVATQPTTNNLYCYAINTTSTNVVPVLTLNDGSTYPPVQVVCRRSCLGYLAQGDSTNGVKGVGIPAFIPAFDDATYCDQTGNGGGWQLAMKIDPSSQTFDYADSNWTGTGGVSDGFANSANDKTPRYAGGNANDFKSAETWTNLPFTQIRVSMTTQGSDTSAAATRHIIINRPTNYTATGGIRQLFGVGFVASTGVTASDWKALVPGGLLQTGSQTLGFNVNDANANQARIRIGIVGDGLGGSDTVAGPNSYIGVGGSYSASDSTNDACISGLANSTGNRAPRAGNLSSGTCLASEGAATVRTWAHVWVR